MQYKHVSYISTDRKLVGYAAQRPVSYKISPVFVSALFSYCLNLILNLNDTNQQCIEFERFITAIMLFLVKLSLWTFNDSTKIKQPRTNINERKFQIHNRCKKRDVRFLRIKYQNWWPGPVRKHAHGEKKFSQMVLKSHFLLECKLINILTVPSLNIPTLQMPASWYSEWQKIPSSKTIDLQFMYYAII